MVNAKSPCFIRNEDSSYIYLILPVSIAAQENRMEVLVLREKDDYINLSQLLKAMNMVESGAMAKEVIDEGLVKVNGEVESRYRRKLYDGMIVEFNGEQIQVVQSQRWQVESNVY